MKSEKEPSLWPLALLGILAVASWFRSKSKTPIQHSANANRTENDTRDHRDTCQKKSVNPLRVIVESLPPAHPPEQQREAREKRKEWCAWGNLFIQVILLVAVIAYACITHRQWKTMKYALDESRKQTGIASQQLESTTRAWLSAEVTITGPLTFERDGLHIRYRVNTQNFGPSPAIFTRILPRIWTGSMMSSKADPIEQKICPEHPFMPVGGTVFPKEDFPQAFDVPVAVDTIKEVTYGHFSPFIVGCVEYAVTASRSETKRTFFAYSLVAHDSKGHGAPFFIGTAVPMNQIGLTPEQWVGVNAY